MILFLLVVFIFIALFWLGTPVEASRLRHCDGVFRELINILFDHSFVYFLADQELLDSFHRDHELYELAEEPWESSDWAIEDAEKTNNGISQREIHRITSPNVHGKTGQLEKLGEELHGDDHKSHVVDSPEIRVQLFFPLGVDLAAEELNPRVQFDHLDIVETFCSLRHSGISFLHQRFLESGASSGEPHVDDYADSEDGDSSEERHTQVIEQKGEAQNDGEWQDSHCRELSRKILHLLRVHLYEGHYFTVRKSFIGSSRNLELLLVDQSDKSIRRFCSDHVLFEIDGFGEDVAESLRKYE